MLILAQHSSFAQESDATSPSWAANYRADAQADGLLAAAGSARKSTRSAALNSALLKTQSNFSQWLSRKTSNATSAFLQKYARGQYTAIEVRSFADDTADAYVAESRTTETKTYSRANGIIEAYVLVVLDGGLVSREIAESVADHFDCRGGEEPQRVLELEILLKEAFGIADPLTEDLPNSEPDVAGRPLLTEVAEWKGTEEMRDGVLHVMNPAEPANGSTTIQLDELWRLGGHTDDEDEFFGLISQVALDDDSNVYLLDTQLNEVKVFATDGSYIRTIGREGEGPGEFKGGTGLFFTPAGEVAVLQAMPTKIVLLTKEGEPAGEYPAPTIEGDGFVSVQGAAPAGDQLVCLAMTGSFNQEKGEFTQNLQLLSVDKEGAVVSSFHSEERLWEFANPVIDELKWDTLQNRWITGGDHVYGCTDFAGYKIYKWNLDGSVDRVIEVEHTAYKRTDAEIKEIEGIYSAFTRMAPNSELKINSHDKDITKIYHRDDGSLWVQSSTGTRVDEGIVGIFDVFDANGHFVQQVTLQGDGNPREDGYFFRGDRLYVVTEFLSAAMAMQGGGGGKADAEPMAVICYRIDDLHWDDR